MARPTKYKPEFCEMLMSHMRKGLSFKTFAGEIGCSRDSLYEWRQRYPEFAHAVDMGQVYSLYFWEKLGIAAIRGEVKGFNTRAWIMTMRNLPLWRKMGQHE